MLSHSSRKGMKKFALYEELESGSSKINGCFRYGCRTQTCLKIIATSRRDPKDTTYDELSPNIGIEAEMPLIGVIQIFVQIGSEVKGMDRLDVRIGRTRHIWNIFHRPIFNGHLPGREEHSNTRLKRLRNIRDIDS